MNYLSTINSFWDSAAVNPLPTGQVSLYLALLHVCNRSNWAEWFQASDKALSVLAGLSKSGMVKAREGLGQRGFIEFNKQGSEAGLYRIIAASDSQEDKEGWPQRGR